MNIQKNNHAAHTKIEIENVLPTEIEKRSFEIITEELGDKKLVPGTELIVKRWYECSVLRSVLSREPVSYLPVLP